MAIDGDKLVDQSGACAIICLVNPDITYVASIGDCHGIVLLKGTKQPEDINIDHKPSNKTEYHRIISNGGKLIDFKKTGARFFTSNHNRHGRIHPGNLNITRTIGDAEAKIKKFGGLPNVISC